MPLKIERRGALPIELRRDEKLIHVRGHAAVFNQEADIGGMFREIIRPGAFARAILQDDVPFLIEHDGLPLARNISGTLKLTEDAIGLAIDSNLDLGDPDVLRVVPKMERGDLNKMSFSFSAKRQEWDDTGTVPLRILHEVELYDVSIVTSPSYDGTDISMRSLNDWRAAQELERKRKNFFSASLRLRLKKRLDLCGRQ